MIFLPTIIRYKSPIRFIHNSLPYFEKFQFTYGIRRWKVEKNAIWSNQNILNENFVNKFHLYNRIFLSTIHTCKTPISFIYNSLPRLEKFQFTYGLRRWKVEKKCYLKQLIIFFKIYWMKEISPSSTFTLWFLGLVYTHVRLL